MVIPDFSYSSLPTGRPGPFSCNEDGGANPGIENIL
jgi:hypothetical protein